MQILLHVELESEISMTPSVEGEIMHQVAFEAQPTDVKKTSIVGSWGFLTWFDKGSRAIFFAFQQLWNHIHQRIDILVTHLPRYRIWRVGLKQVLVEKRLIRMMCQFKAAIGVLFVHYYNTVVELTSLLYVLADPFWTALCLFICGCLLTDPARSLVAMFASYCSCMH